MPFINGIGAPELIIILVIALIVVGPGRLPDVGSALGKSIREFRKAATDVKDATSLEPKAETAAPARAPQAPAPPPAPLAESTTAAPVAAPQAAVADGAAAVPVPDISEMPEPVPAADEQRTPTA